MPKDLAKVSRTTWLDMIHATTHRRAKVTQRPRVESDVEFIMSGTFLDTRRGRGTEKKYVVFNEVSFFFYFLIGVGPIMSQSRVCWIYRETRSRAHAPRPRVSLKEGGRSSGRDAAAAAARPPSNGSRRDPRQKASEAAQTIFLQGQRISF